MKLPSLKGGGSSPVFNLRNKNWADRFKEFMKG